MPGEELLANRAPEELHKGITTTSASNLSFIGGFYTSIYSTGNKKKLETCMSARYNVTGIADVVRWL